MRVLYGGDNEKVGWVESIDELVQIFSDNDVEVREIHDLIMNLLDNGHHLGQHGNGRYFAVVEPK